jgi:hypothetical protein
MVKKYKESVKEWMNKSPAWKVYATRVTGVPAE